MTDDTEFFATMSFKGERFNKAFIPVDALPAISNYQDALVQMAIAIWKEANPDRERLPRNFSKAFELGLKDIGEGSKVAHLPRRFQDNPELFDDEALGDIFVEAQERLASVITAANENKVFTPLPESVIAPFDRIRRSIEKTEFIDINPLAHGKKRTGVFRVSDSTIVKIIEQSRIRLHQEVDSLGFVTGITESPSALRVTSANGTFSYPISWSELREQSRIKIGSVVHFVIDVETDAVGQIKEFRSPVALSPATTNNLYAALETRLAEISKLKPRWCDGEGAVASQETLMRAGDFAVFLSRFFSNVKIFPSLDGGVQFEWKDRNIAASLHVADANFLLGASDLSSELFNEKSFKGLSPALVRSVLDLPTFVGRSG